MLPSGAIPMEHVAPSTLVRIMRDTYDARLAQLNLAPLLKKFSGEQIAKLDTVDALKELMRTKDSGVVIGFEGGKFPTQYDFVPLLSMAFNFESITSRVAGQGVVADVVAKEFAEIIWASCGVTKRWEEISERVQLIAYATATKVKLGFPLEELFSGPTRAFLDEQALTGPKYAAEMGTLSARHSFGKSDNVSVLAFADEVHIAFKKFDQDTGRGEDNLMKFSVTARDEYGTGIVNVTSHLSYERHVEFLEQLRQYVLGSSSGA
ncbi:hypothetical protein Snoj_55290 [Streptomyces nojiriensis]|uniref:Uncharacterized protein n=1 Tax=Streptomyces nojiriensis TaxID=66374 RepID=A0ABQ3SU28_9ACTN|nr:hypothetical protein JYK04_02939 [Streptomyces nojiriensis]GGR94117.1 hypothetical protein GCM10010205_23540 [Streptomyces nojiriensis]GHI71611.1 hypothetical protein Snoj_55290 [Streptomyces nojiriensis]